jgi:hypothetical protein
MTSSTQKRAKSHLSKKQNPQITVPLIDVPVLDAVKIDGSAKAFFSQAKKPKFKYIAPGISIPTPAQISNFPFSNIHNPDIDSRPPILLFPPSEMFKDIGLAFNPPYDLSTYSYSLYLSPITRRSQNTFKDPSTLFPYKIGKNGFSKNR